MTTTAPASNEAPCSVARSTSRSTKTEQQPSPFHPGERAVQQDAGVRDEAEKRGQRMLTPDLNDQQVRFFHDLPFLITGHTDEEGQPWAGLLTGQPGFIQVSAAQYHCSINLQQANNATAGAFLPGGSVGLLGIDLATRRRNRLNGTVLAADTKQWNISIEQGYGNCPKYITERDWPASRFDSLYAPEETDGLSPHALALADKSDTFFIATASGPTKTPPNHTSGNSLATMTSAWGADVSHRGGDPGFLSGQGNQLCFEDFSGNNMFNTLGNISQFPKCGILLIDFNTGELLQLTAVGTIVKNNDKRIITLDVSNTRHWRPQSRH